MSALATLRAEHDALLATAREARSLLAAGTRPAEIGAQLAQLATALRIHLEAEETMLAPLLAAAPADVLSLSRASAHALAEVTRLLRVLGAGWAGSDAASERMTHDTGRVLEALEARIRRENEAVLPLLEAAPVSPG